MDTWAPPKTEHISQKTGSVQCEAGFLGAGVVSWCRIGVGKSSRGEEAR